MYEIKIVRFFSAAHFLADYHGKCEALHGHNWKVEVMVRREGLGEGNMALDFSRLKRLTDEVLDTLDHKNLNELPYFRDQNPSSEVIARYIFESLEKRLEDEDVSVYRVNAWESRDSCAGYMK
ncbi:MAG: 6-carboxytetrahydropterin synthase QueD [Deltaproteobacteria bacterium]|nr:MAG: 6-carboxytetrahydropterin synthase QueD [Deltaproteobacteria bacterium]